MTYMLALHGLGMRLTYCTCMCCGVLWCAVVWCLSKLAHTVCYIPFSLCQLLLGVPPERWAWHGEYLVAERLREDLEAGVARVARQEREHGVQPML